MKILVLLTDPSLLAQGIVARLRRSFDGSEIETMDIHRPDLIEALTDVKPQIIILDASNRPTTETCPLHQIFTVLPDVIVIEVNLADSQIQVIRSDHYTASGFSDLLHLIEGAKTNFSNSVDAISS